MSIWTFNTSRLAGALALAALAGCGGGAPRALPDGRTAPIYETRVTSDQLLIRGPEGFCVDPASTRDTGETGFVLMGNCAVLSNHADAGQPDPTAVLTASIAAPDPERSLQEAIPELDRFFRSEEGREILSRTGDPSSVDVLDSFHQGGVFFLHARDTSASEVQGVAQEYWRSYLDIGDRLATLTVLASEEAPIEAEASLEVLRSFTQAVAQGNAGSDRPEQPSVTAPAAAPDTAPTPQQSGPLWNVGLFRRIMGR